MFSDSNQTVANFSEQLGNLKETLEILEITLQLRNNMAIDPNIVPSALYIRCEGGLSDDQLISRFQSSIIAVVTRKCPVKICPTEPQIRIKPQDKKLQ